MVEITRTTQLKIGLDLAIAERTIQSWTSTCNFISQIAHSHGCLSRVAELQKFVYYPVRERFGLSAQITVSAIRVVASKYASARINQVERKRPVRFRLNAVVLQGGERGRDFSFTETGLSVSFKRDIPDIDKPNDAVIGVDRGINFLAVATDGKRQCFFAGGHTKHVRARYDKTRASLQRKKAQKPTRSIRRALKRLSGRKARFMRDVNHQVSKTIVEFGCETGNPTIAVEALDGIRERGKRFRRRQRKDIHSWAFGQLQDFIEYKAEGYGFEVLEVDPRNTSKRCSRCGYIDAANRHGHTFSCRACGYTLHADLNGARNTRLRGLLARQDLGGDGLASRSPEARMA